MIVNRAMAGLSMCVSRIHNMVEPLYSNPQKDPLTVEALNNTQVPPPFEVPKEDKEIKEEYKEIYIKELRKSYQWLILLQLLLLVKSLVIMLLNLKCEKYS